jgi:hypothetical protein
MTLVGFEPMIPVFERAKTVSAIDRAATVIGLRQWLVQLIGYGLEDRGFMEGGKKCSLLCNVQTASGIYPAPYTSIGGCFPGSEADHSPPPSIEGKSGGAIRRNVLPPFSGLTCVGWELHDITTKISQSDGALFYKPEGRGFESR